jgi:hypothetical protein
MKKWISIEEFCEKHKIGKWNHYFAESKNVFEFSLEEFKMMVDINIVFNGIEGGLVLGNSHRKGGIHMIRQTSENTFAYVGEMEGWEYLTHYITTAKNKDDFEIINNKTKPISKYIKTNFKIPEKCKIIDTTKCEIAFILVSSYSQFIVNRFATKKHINEIIELDKI